MILENSLTIHKVKKHKINELGHFLPQETLLKLGHSSKCKSENYIKLL